MNWSRPPDRIRNEIVEVLGHMVHVLHLAERKIRPYVPTLADRLRAVRDLVTEISDDLRGERG